MMKRYLVLALTALAVVASQVAFAEIGQTKTGVAAKSATRQASARRAYDAMSAKDATNPGASVPIARPPAQPGAW
jgi:hypothetical protein